MRAAKWGKNLGVCFPAEIVEKLKIAPGDEFQFTVVGENEIQIVRDPGRQLALQILRRHRVKLPERYVFDRDEIYGR